ncbi:T9SS type A sorting domain-containing protein [Polaribacter pectinis]|uniref:T9SS type A sorting domain-containing protein n=1 Tax=Polaribacter pectinis TaxID=2738844 RepID=A0A7G9L688_9FLAO|nr:T9SS type A sorting domain-containing protein [Polaribacter pectinis]QNM84137.1 T9SS type A sorting domain-containing protein [Polaribacter pectinis]
MTKKISPNFLRRLIVLIIFSKSLTFFSQNVDVSIIVDWNQWSTENKIELYSPTDIKLLTIVHPNGYSAGSSSDVYDAILPSTPLNISVNDNIPAESGYYVILYDRYGDGWNSNGNMSITIDGVANSFTFDGNFSTSATNSEITQTEYFAVNKTIVLDDASFSYSKNSYCGADSNPTPTITGENGGTFSSTSGLSLNSSSGQINIAASTIGNYVVTYTTTNPDQNSSTKNISITSEDVATFSYPTSRVNKNDLDLLPTTTGQSGTYSSTSGLDINSSTGVIDVSDSTEGTYTVTYTTNGSCPITITDSVTIINEAFPGVSQYQNSSKKYIEYIPGTMPIIISAPHGGRLQPSELPTRSCGTNEMDDNTDVLIKEIQKKCFDQFGAYPYIIVNRLHRRKLDPNRNESVATCGNSTAKIYFDAFHGFIDQASTDINNKFGKGLYIDLHGQSHSIPRIEAGYNLPSSSFDEDLNNTSTNTTELARVTIKNLIENNISNSTFEDLIRGENSFGGIMQVTGGIQYANLGYAGCSRTEGYRTVPSNIGNGNQGSCDDTNPGSNSYFAGDYYSNIRHGSGDTSTNNSVVQGGGTVKGGGGTIDGIMTEVNRRVRDLGSVYSSTYGVSDGNSPTIPYFSRDYAKVIEKFIDVHYNDFSNFTFTENSYSIHGLDPTPTINGISGGTFSSTSGLSINSSTGKIDLSASTQGTYMVSYTAPNVGEYYKKEFQITINDAAVTNEFIANSGNWSDSNNWSLTRLPITIDIVSIPVGKTANLNLENVFVNNISVAGVLNINAGKSITVTENLTTTGTTKIKSNATSSGSLIVNGTVTGNISYDRYIKDNTSWYLISSPVENQDIDLFANATPLLAGSGNNRSLSSYNNVTPGWDYYQNGTTTSGNFTIGKGHSIRISSAGNITFTGDLKTDDVEKEVKVGTNGWNLIGNPFPSFLNLNDPANSVNNIIDINFNVLQSGFKAIYFWDTASATYKPFNNASDAKYISPGQGYFVRVSSDGIIKMNENMQNHKSENLFMRGESERFEIKLKMNNGTLEKNTDIKYINGTTTGLDDGYDAGLFSGSSTSFALYTHLVAENDGTKYALQALPDSDFNSMIVPVGINAIANSEITFSADILNIPNGLKVYIEDKELNTFTRIDETNASYKVELSSDLNSGGRFYIHTTTETLSITNDIVKENIQIFKTGKRILTINGLEQGKSKVKVYNTIGKEVFNTNFSNQLSKEIILPKLTSGIYFIQLESNSKKINKKIILE